LERIKKIRPFLFFFFFYSLGKKRPYQITILNYIQKRLLSTTMGQYYYAVNRGLKTGIYETWAECEKNVKGQKNAVFKKFQTYEEAQHFLKVGRAIYRPVAAPKEPVFNEKPPVIPQSIIASHRPSPAGRITPKIPVNKRPTTPYQPYPLVKPTYAKKATTVVYTDGASSNNGKGHAKAGYGVYWGPNDPRNASERLPGDRQTNQRAETAAVIHALEQSINDKDLLEIRTDSQYVINAATTWSKNWIKKGWKSTNGKEVQNRDLFERMLDLIDKKKGNVKFTYVPGHQGVEGNEKADQLAVAGATKSLNHSS
jgi:ribonuclease HI